MKTNSERGKDLVLLWCTMRAVKDYSNKSLGAAPDKISEPQYYLTSSNSQVQWKTLQQIQNLKPGWAEQQKNVLGGTILQVSLKDGWLGPLPWVNSVNISV